MNYNFNLIFFLDPSLYSFKRPKTSQKTHTFRGLFRQGKVAIFSKMMKI